MHSTALSATSYSFLCQLAVGIIGVGIGQGSFPVQESPHVPVSVIQIGGGLLSPRLRDQRIAPCVGSKEGSLLEGSFLEASFPAGLRQRAAQVG